MIIKTSFEALDKAMTTVSNIVADKNLSEEFKNLVVWVKDGQVRFAAYGGNIVNATPVDATAVYSTEEQPETLFQLKAKDINDVLSSFKGLKRTKVTDIEFHIRENEAVMNVVEEPQDESMSHANEYNQVSKFRISKPRLKDLVKNEIQRINMEVEGTDISSVDVLLYINALLPTVAKETREGTYNVMFGDEYIYTVVTPYSSVMPNKLPEVMRGFKLSNSLVAFLKNFISSAEYFTFHKQEMGKGGVVLTVKVGDSVALIKCYDLSRAFDITNFVSVPSNGIVVDKAYLVDVLKRLNLSGDAATVEITIGEHPSMKVLTANMTQNIPVINSKGEGLYSFSIRSEHLANAIFSHITDFDVNVYIYVEEEERSMVMACSDNSQLWQTKIKGLAQSKANYSWG